MIKGIAMDEAGHFIGFTWDWLDWRSILVALTLIQPQPRERKHPFDLDDADLLADLHWVRADRVSLHHPEPNHDLSSRSRSQCPSVYAHLYWSAYSYYAVLQHLQLCGVPRQSRWGCMWGVNE